MTSPLTVFGYASGCPACDKLTTLLDLLGVPFAFHAIDRNSPERAALKDAGFDTVPQVFAPNGLHIGDFSTFRRASSLGIEAMLTPYGG